MRVLVTGASGSVGSAVVARYVADGHDVRAVVRGGDGPAAAEIVSGDVADGAAVLAAAQGVDLCVHCAASVSSDLDECRRVNVQGTRNVVDALVAGGRATLVHVSTLSVYDDAAGPTFDEDSPLWTAPTDGAYGFTKAEAERVVGAAGARGLRAVILRPTAILSMHPRSRWGPLAVARARTATACILPFPELPYVHVDNLVEAIVLAATTPAARGRAYNVVDAVADTRQYLAAVYGAAGCEPAPIPPGAPLLRFAARRIREELGWSPRDRWLEFLGQLRAAQ